MQKDQRRLYNDLAWIWPIISPVAEYVEESEQFVRIINENSQIKVKTMLHLGCGGGRSDHTFKKYFQVTGVDLSNKMLAQARKLNPEVTYKSGDMRTVRLNKTFDTVVIPDSIDYMATKKDLRQAYQTAFRHLKPGGIFLALIDEYAEKFQQNKCFIDSHSSGDIELASIENYYDPDPKDTSYEVTFIHLIREKGKLRIETDHHICGLFALSVWQELLKEVGFEVKQLEIRFSGPRPGLYVLLLGIKPV